MFLLRSFHATSTAISGLIARREYATFLCVGALAAFAGLAAADVNATGNWSGTFNVTRSNGERSDSTAFLKLKQTGSEITGTVGPNELEQFAIQKGKLDGDKITLEAVDPNGHKIKFDLKVHGDRITGEANMSDANDSAKATLDVKRVK